MNKDKAHKKARSLYCENYCNIKENIHIHTKESSDFYFGVDIKTMEESVGSTSKSNIMKIPCIFCGFASTTIEEHKHHFKKCQRDHSHLILTIECFMENCNFECEDCIPEEVLKHVAEVHLL